MSARQRHRFAAKLLRSLAAGGFISMAACGMSAEPAPIEDPAAPEVRIERDLERLRALDVMELGELMDSRTDASGSIYTAVPLSVEEQAQRLEALTDIAEVAVTEVAASAITDQFVDPAGEPNLCTRIDADSYCLTIAMHENNLQRVNQLEVIEVNDIIRSDAPVSGACYSSWDPVTEDECVRALKLSAIVENAEGHID